ncbi:hypothetical protein KW447_12450 [Vibrio fluvialis]|nr:hypothetical protein [Vibrio fluvialis]
MASETDLVQLVENHKRVWTAERVCTELNVDVCELAILLRNVQRTAKQVIVHSSDPTGYSHKIWLEG